MKEMDLLIAKILRVIEAVDVSDIQRSVWTLLLILWDGFDPLQFYTGEFCKT